MDPLAPTSASTETTGLHHKDHTHQEIANKLIEEGVYHYREGKDYEKARISFESAREIAKSAGLEMEEARALGNLANAHSNLNENISASDLYRMSLFLFRKLGASAKEIIILKNAANVECSLKHWDDAIKLHKRRAELCLESQQENERSESIAAISMLQAEIEKEVQAAERSRIETLWKEGRGLMESKKFEQAEKVLTEAFYASEALKDKRWEGKIRLEKARIIFEQQGMGIHSGTAFVDEMTLALPLLEANASREEFFAGLDELTTYYVSLDKTKDAIDVLERKVRCFEVKSDADRAELEEVIQRLSVMRAKVHHVNDLHSLTQSPHSPGGKKRPVSMAEDRLRKAEMSAARQRELMQLSFREIPLELIEKRMACAESSMAQLSPFVKSYGQAEGACAKLLRESMAKSVFYGEKAVFKEQGTLQGALESLKLHVAQVAGMREQYEIDLKGLLVNPIEQDTKSLSSFCKHQVEQRKKQAAVRLHIIDRIDDIKRKLLDSESSAAKLQRQVDGLSEADRRAPSNALVQRARRKHLEIKELKQNLAQAERDFFHIEKDGENVRVHLADEYQRYELSRIAGLKEQLSMLVQVEENHLKQRGAMLQRLKMSVEEIDNTSDVRLFTHEQSVRALCGGRWKTFKSDYSSPGPVQSGNAAFDNAYSDLAERQCFEMFLKEVFVGEEDGGETGAENATAMLPSLLPLLGKESYRQNLIRLMNLQRSKVQNVGLGFDVLITVINEFLDKCVEQNDVKGAKMMMIMSETFFRSVKPDAFSLVDGVQPGQASRETSREYLQGSIKEHRIWQNPHFWEEAFFLSVREEVVKHMRQVEEGSVSRESDFGRFYKNIVFGQLGSYALNMLNFGVGVEATTNFINKLCHVNKMEEEKNTMLLENAKLLAAKQPCATNEW